LLFAALAGKPAEIDRFLGVLGGAVPIPEFFAPNHLVKLLGLRSMAKIALSKLRSRSMRTSAAPATNPDASTVP
jgi:hypothetical protein